MTWSNILFYLAFSSQIFLMSYYFPKRLLGCMQFVLQNYPPETHPKLYPKSREHYERLQRNFAFACRCILLLGVALVPILMFWVDHANFADHGYISKAWPAAYGVLQFLPLVAIEISEHSHMRQMRRVNASTKRTAELRPRRLNDYVSPLLPAATLALLAAYIGIDFYLHDFTTEWSSDSMQRTLVILGTNALLVFVGASSVYGPKKDPHLSNEDRARGISIAVKSLMFVSMAMSVFFTITAIDDVFSLDAVDALILSLYMQAVTLFSLGYTLRERRTHRADFDVYREDATAA